MKLTELIYAFLIGSSIQSTVISGTYISKKFLGKLYKQHFTSQSVLLPILAPILFGIFNMISVYLVYDRKYSSYIPYYMGLLLGIILAFPNTMNIDPLSLVFGFSIKNPIVNGIVSIFIYIFVFGYLIGNLNQVAFG